MESFLCTLGLLTTCLLQAAYWNAFQEAASPYTRSNISTVPISCSLLSSLLWAAYALPIVTPRRVLFLLAHLLQSLSLSALLLAVISSDSSSYTLRLRQVLQLLLPASGLSILVLSLGSFFAPSSLVIGWTASAAAALLLASQPLSRMLTLLDTATGAQSSHLFVSCSALAAACTWAAFGFAAQDHFIAVPYVVAAALEALFLALSSFVGQLSASQLSPAQLKYAPAHPSCFPCLPSHPHPLLFSPIPIPIQSPPIRIHPHPYPPLLHSDRSLPISNHPHPSHSAASSAPSRQRAAEGYELVAPTASESGLTEQSL
ncbi:unnamed protein product [Closterium sp. Naga37s-1]|nr:unnamed protein product [Closterium sp. Naga37s-1]